MEKMKISESGNETVKTNIPHIPGNVTLHHFVETGGKNGTVTVKERLFVRSGVASFVQEKFVAYPSLSAIPADVIARLFKPNTPVIIQLLLQQPNDFIPGGIASTLHLLEVAPERAS